MNSVFLQGFSGLKSVFLRDFSGLKSVFLKAFSGLKSVFLKNLSGLEEAITIYIYVTTVRLSRMQMERYGIFYLENLARTFAGFAASREFYLHEGDFSEFRVIFGWELRERFWIIQYPDGV